MVAHPGSPEQLYMGAGFILLMTRKDKLKKGIVARTFHIPIEIDDELRMMAIQNHVRFSDEATLALKEHISRRKN